jgi:uncharacterized protein
VSQDAPPTDPERDKHDSADDGDLGPFPFALLVLFEAGLAPASLLFGLPFGRHPLADFQWSNEAALTGVLAALPMLAMLGAILRWPVGPLIRIKDYFDKELAPALDGCEWPDLAVLSVAAGVGEEMLFRGLIQGLAARFFGGAAGLVLASLLFGLLHPVSLIYIVVAAVLGVYLGAVWLLTGNLLVVMIAHAVYDFVAMAVLLRLRPSAPDVEPPDA